MDTFLSGYKRKDKDNEAGSSKDNEAISGRETVRKNINAENTLKIFV
jgi:hypothetical protein